MRARTWISSFRMLAAGLALAGCSASLLAPPAFAASSKITTIVVVRHGEKATDDPRDPSLSPAGQERAQALANALDGAGLSAVYVTEFKRTRLTAEPTAQHFGLTIQTKPRTDMQPEAYAADLVPKVLKKHLGKVVLIVGHSDTVPAIVKALTGKTVPPIDEATEFDRLYVVEIPKSGAPRLIATRYGRPRP
ncbi:MAG TPA: phosphoglycerate mutase family protein [Thermoanaerobaculia bacterium]|nr:phosphoglycerate mutase family protein [Thermoanaerobaculia bacterium]